MPKPILFDEESEEEVTLKTENDYAKKYDKWREKEELHKLEQKYGSKPLNSDGEPTSDSEDESDAPPEVSEEMEAQFLKTLSLLKTKDPRIYDPQYKFFDESQKKEPEKPKTKQLTFADSDDDDDDGNIFSIEKKAEITEDKKQRKTSETKEIKLKEYLTGEADHIDDPVEKDLAPLKALWSDPKLNEGEAFLRDYILNKRYLEEGDVGDAEDKIRDDEELEADEERVEEQGKFERAYNFRFEEPDQEYLKRFPRTMNYIRPKDDKRSRKRAEVRSRKEEEKQRKMEEIARLKALKLKEIQEKIARIKEVTGNEELAFKEEDLESEFDPAEHDKRMREIFDEQYYGDADDTKPVFPDLDDELEIENWEKYEPEHEAVQEDEEGPHCEDDDFNMDAEYDPKQARGNLLEELKKTLGKKRRNRKKKSKLAELLSSEKPKFVPTVEDKTYDQYMEEYYKMDCEDVIGGDLPTRFKYREVVPNDYGLTVEEILLADDKELTQWVPLKKILKHRPDNVEKGDAKTYAQKAADVRLKKKILPSLFKDLPEEPEIVVPIEETKKKKKKKNKQKNTEDGTVAEAEQEQAEGEVVEELTENNKVEETSKKKKKDKHKKNATEEDQQIEEGTNPEVNGDVKQKKKKKKHKTDGFSVENVNNDKPTQETSQDNVIVREGKKKKNKQSKVNENGDSVETSAAKEQNKDSSLTDSNETPSKKKDKNLKRKADTNAAEPSKKKKKGNKEFKKNFKNDKFKNKNKVGQPVNPLVNLSDERLKAFGLNPKRYKNFMKFKKF
ncbi:protein KRI1 homolog isoform X2 [Trichoplusia ni]|uniref:Protein KRI1 homolog n=1 Tax=Trichoplusia ni TaxID=7111 RepID=A0A7E5WFC2_TRINI|nr:protein KRI1 homolog isoform X2 [Trichoplusia ni]